jgi:ATP-dependent DNA ligase
MWYALPTGGNPDRTHIAQDGAALQPEQTCSGKPVSSGLEGLVRKHRDRAYRAGTSPDWVKVKNRKHPSIERVKNRLCQVAAGRCEIKIVGAW